MHCQRKISWSIFWQSYKLLWYIFVIVAKLLDVFIVKPLIYFENKNKSIFQVDVAVFSEFM